MKNDVFNSRIGTLAALAGSAVGLGNIWRFPYICGENGGGAFLVIYIAFTFLISVPVLLTEFAIGRMTGKSIVKAFRSLAPRTKWYYVGICGVVCPFLIISFYNIVSGWTLYYTYESLTGGLSGLNETEVSQFFADSSSNIGLSFFWMIISIAIVSQVVARGVADGIEKVSKVLMPLLIVLIIVVCIRAVTLDGASEGLKFLLLPDFSKVTPHTIFAALGQSFFSMSIGMGIMTTYGAYIQKHENLSQCAIRVAMVDFFIAFMAGVMIFPCAFAFGINPGSGPGLVFVTLPNIFNQMFMGRAISVVFFLLLVIAALTSSISLFEVLVSFFKDQFHISRRKASIIMAAAITVTGFACVVSPTLFNLFDSVTANIMLPLCAFFIVLFVPIVLKRARIKEELEAHGKPMAWFNLYYFLLKFIVPAAIMLIFINGMLDWIGIDIF